MAEQTTHGDTDLATRAGRHLGRRHERFVAAQVVGGEARVTAVGLGPRADLEIGSVSKGLTGMLLADSRDRGETRDDTRLGHLLPLTGTPASDITLGELATHRSGLPRLADGTRVLRATVELWRHGTNPYGEGLDDLLAATGRTRLRRRRPRYSNLGFMLLGHALAASAGTTYAVLLRDRVTAPLGMVDTTVPATGGDLGPRAAQGCSRRGRPVEPWTGEAVGPAGGIRSTAGDLGRLVQALLDGSAPGVNALDPVARFSGPVRIGGGWLTVERRGTLLTWHNGGTGGFRSVVALDRGAGAGVALVSACARSVDRAGFALLQEASGRAVRVG
jgi:CubicO group peptidase (beta-lactamase class C family)